jgi:hypothetical protein
MARGIQYLMVFSLMVSYPASQDKPPNSSENEGEKLVLAALDRFHAVEKGHVRSYFKAIRPAKLTDFERSQVLASLPREGEASPSADAISKLTSISPILAYHDRESVIEVKVIRVFQAAVALYARCVLLISEEGLRLLSAAELQALVAHELGHEYVWNAFEAAKSSGDHQKLQQLELWCDGVAILTLLDLGLDPRALTSAISKVNRFNRRFGTPDNANDYPSDAVRSEFHKRVARLFADTDKRADRRH